MKKSTRLLLLLLLPLLLSTCASRYAREIGAHRDDYRQKFLSTPHSPLQAADLPNLRFYEPDAAYRVVAAVEPTPFAEPFAMPTSAGTMKQYVQYATLRFTLDGREHTLDIYRSPDLSRQPQYRDYLFLPFKDTTNGSETYGGGRYLDFRTGDIKDGKLVIDFNKAYNPYCVYSAGYQCPVPPRENHLEVAIRAGERMYAGKYKGEKG